MFWYVTMISDLFCSEIQSVLFCSQEFQVLARPFVLRTLTHMALNDVFHCTYAK